jgi:hypothetical protein
MSHVCMETNSEGWLPPISRCCGMEVDDDAPLTFCPKCEKLAVWECADCGDVEFDSTIEKMS